MARARNIKPSFFTNDTLAEVDPLGRLLFQGLWCLADREGRLEDRPKRIKAELLPYDNCDVDSLLGELNRLGFILRYSVNGNRFIQVVNFAKHQNPHVKEAASQIPAPDEHCASTMQDTEEPEQAGLIPDSPSLIPDPLNLIPEGNASPKAPPAAQGKRLSEDWQPTAEEIAFCKEERPDLDPASVADRFRDYWIAQPGVKGRKSNWTATWRNWVRGEKGVKSGASPPTAATIWHETDAGYQSKAEELGLQRKESEPFQWFKWRIAKKVGDQGVIDKLLSAAQRDGIAEHERAFQFFHGRPPNSPLRAPEEA